MPKKPLSRFSCACLLMLGIAGCATTSWNTASDDPAARHRKEIAAAKKYLKNPVKTHMAYATWQEKLGNVQEARESYEIVLGLQPDSVDAALGLARLDALSGELAQAEKRLRELREKYPQNAAVAHAWGQFLAGRKRWDEAAEALKLAVKLAPDERSYRFHLAVALARAGRIAEARPHFVQLVGDAEADYNLAIILYEQGRIAEAERRLVQAVLKKPTLKQAQIWLDELRREKQAALASGLTAEHTETPSEPPRAVTSIQSAGLEVPDAGATATGIQHAAAVSAEKRPDAPMVAPSPFAMPDAAPAQPVSTTGPEPVDFTAAPANPPKTR